MNEKNKTKQNKTLGWSNDETINAIKDDTELNKGLIYVLVTKTMAIKW